MELEYATLRDLRNHHPAWKLLRAEYAPFVVSFLRRTFIIPNVRTMAEADLIEALEDEIFSVRRIEGDGAFPHSARVYLNEWASPEKGWLRKFYRADTDEPQFDITTSVEHAIAWLGTLADRSFVGTESRLRTLFDLLKQMAEGTETDPVRRLADLEKRRDAIDVEIAAVNAGDLRFLDDTAIKDRFQQFIYLASALLGDFREVEQNFRRLDRDVRERIALWVGSKGALLEHIMGERDAITASDQGRSFLAFWEFLMSSQRQEEFTSLLGHVLSLSAVRDLNPDARTRRVHYDWLEAGEQTQRTVAQLSHQLRRLLDDRAWLENRRIMDILHEIEACALALRNAPPPGAFMEIAEMAASISLPMERPLYSPVVKPSLAAVDLLHGDEELNADALYTQIEIDHVRLAQQVSSTLNKTSQVSLKDLTLHYPLEQGLAELIGYLQVGVDSFATLVNEDVTDVISWTYETAEFERVEKEAKLPRVIFLRK